MYVIKHSQYQDHTHSHTGGRVRCNGKRARPPAQGAGGQESGRFVPEGDQRQTGTGGQRQTRKTYIDSPERYTTR